MLRNEIRMNFVQKNNSHIRVLILVFILSATYWFKLVLQQEITNKFEYLLVAPKRHSFIYFCFIQGRC